MIGRLKAWWRRRQRAIDLEILWWACVDLCKGDLVCARNAFAFHCVSDPAWSDVSEAEIDALVARLEA